MLQVGSGLSFGRMRPPRHLMSPDRIVVVLACAVAALSVVAGLRWVAPTLDGWKDDYGTLSPSGREDAVPRSLGFDPGVWSRLRREVLAAGDRYAVVASGVDRFEVRNYAAYALLPAIQVSDATKASVIVFYGSEPPRGTACTPVGEGACVARRSS